MAGETSAQIAAMAEAAGHVDNAGQALATIRGTVAQAVAATASGYNSPAAVMFRNTMDQWHGDFQKIIAGLERMHQALTHTTRHYEATLEQERNSANEIAALLNGGGI
jgi:WXG100 family type VII secretion target